MRYALALALTLSAAPAFAEAPEADPAIVSLFEETCLKGEPSLAGREAALAAGGWSGGGAGEAKLKFLEPNPMNGDFAKPQSVRLWTKTVGGRAVRALLATYKARGFYETACVLVVADVKSSWPYWDALGDALKPLGVKAKETDLPHFRAYGGKLADGRKARATISSRSAILPGEKGLMHMFIAY